MTTEFFKLEVIKCVIKDMEESLADEFSLDTIVSRLRRKNFESGTQNCPECGRGSSQFHERNCSYRNLE